MPPRGSLRCLWVGLPWWGEDMSGSHRGTWFLAQQHPDKCPKDIQFTCLRLLLEIKKPLHEQRMRYYFFDTRCKARAAIAIRAFLTV